MIIQDKDPVLTSTFNKTVVGLEKSLAQKKIIGFISPSGVGFKYAIERVARKHYLNIVVCNVHYSASIRRVMVSLSMELCNMKFSRINHKQLTLFELFLEINETLKTSKPAHLLVLDHCESLRNAQLKYFVEFLKRFNRSTGLVFRMNTQYLRKVNRKEPTLYEELYKVVDDWRVLERPTDDDIHDICKSNGVTDREVIEGLTKRCGNNLSILKKHFDRYHNYLVTQQGKVSELRPIKD